MAAGRWESGELAVVRSTLAACPGLYQAYWRRKLAGQLRCNDKTAERGIIVVFTLARRVEVRFSLVCLP